MSRFEDVLEEARRLYQSLGSVICPVFSDEAIAFNNKGFSHLLRKAVVRSRSQQLKRLGLLRYVPMIIGHDSAQVEYRQTASDSVITRYWAFYKVIDGKKLKVVLRQVGRGRKHFYSVFELYQEPPG